MMKEPRKTGDIYYWALRDICNELGISAIGSEKYYLEEHEMLSCIISAIRFLRKTNAQMALRIKSLNAQKEKLSQTDLFTQ